MKFLKEKKKILISLIISFVVASSVVYAGFLFDLADGIGGILLWPARAGLCLLGMVLQLLMGNLTLQGLLFYQHDQTAFSKILDINVFNPGGDANIQAIRDNIAIWYTSLRNVAIVLIAIIAVYVGLRMALSTIAEDQAKYKKMLIDWLKSLALLFLLHYMILAIIVVNDALVKVIYNGLTNAQASQQFSDLADALKNEGFGNARFSIGMACAVAYLMLEIETFLFFIQYIKRMVTVCFMITIAPLVTITYSIDKMKDGKSQAFDTWLKEFSMCVLIQPFHCVTYAVLGSTAANIMLPSGATFEPETALPGLMAGLVMLGFILPAENIVRKIFGVEPNNLGRAMQNMAMLNALTKGTTNAAKFTGKALKNSKVGQNAKNKFKASKVGRGFERFSKTKGGKIALSTGAHLKRMNTSLFHIGTGTALGGATGEGKTVATNIVSALNTSSEKWSESKKTQREHELSRAMHAYGYNYDGKGGQKTDKEVAQVIQGLLDGTIKASKDDATYGDTTGLYNAVLNMRANLGANGVSERSKQDKSIMSTVKQISKGEIGDYSSFPSALDQISPEHFLGRGPMEYTRQDKYSKLGSYTGDGAAELQAALARLDFDSVLDKFKQAADKINDPTLTGDARKQASADYKTARKNLYGMEDHLDTLFDAYIVREKPLDNPESIFDE